MKITAPRAVLALATAFTLIGSVAAVATPTLSGTTLSLAAGDSAAVTCAGPSLAWSATSATSGSLSCAPVATTTEPTTTTTATTTPAPPAWWQPGPIASWQWQLSDAIDTSRPVAVYDIDYSEDASVVATLHSQGKKVICYIDVGGWENYRPDANQYASSVLGNKVDGWASERYVDVRALDGAKGPTGKTLHDILRARIASCQSKGFDAVETDLDDQYPASTGFPLTKVDYERFDKALAADIHGLGMAWFLKNGITGDSFIADLVPYADGTVNEQCWEFNECDALRPFVNARKPILNAEYSGAQATVCPKATGFPMATMKKYIDLRAAVIWKCWA